MCVPFVRTPFLPGAGGVVRACSFVCVLCVRAFAWCCPTLPSGGILPSAMTCTNYLKLPDYPTKALMAEKLNYSIRECQTGFQLS